ncbi:MAG TPA: alpha/beta fold hydrolase [Gemmatimonadales bacterium]|jgi:proline iminopeptidase|nr:alpha/beta fold hydrolase [Gemmatimonadales bacterium]
MANNAQTRMRAVRGVEIFERRIGSGPPAVTLHGGPGAHHDYLLPGFDALAHDRELIYYDQRGGGQSQVPRETPVGWREQAADLEELRRQWGLETLTIIGYSWGGLLAQLYATEFPQRVGRLALVSPAPAWREMRLEFERRFAERNLAPALQQQRAELRASALREKNPEEYAQRVFELSVAPYFYDPARARDLTPFRVTGRTQQEVWSSLGNYDLRPALAGLDVPAIVLQGEDDPIPLEATRTVARLLKAELHLLPRCGHVPYIEAHEEFVRLLEGFLVR